MSDVNRKHVVVSWLAGAVIGVVLGLVAVSRPPGVVTIAAGSGLTGETAGEPCAWLYPDGTWAGDCGPAGETPTPDPYPAPPTETATIVAPTDTPTPPDTPTPEPTSTATATAEPPAGHNPTEWHELTEEFAHHHGYNPWDYVDVFGPPLIEYLNTYGSISYPWATPNENELKHTGYIWLYDEAEGGCEQFGQGEGVEGLDSFVDGLLPAEVAASNCVTHVLVQVHSIGTPLAVQTRYHSDYAFIRVCDLDGQSCGVVATGGWTDYGVLHAPYKNNWCQLESDPPGWGDLLTDQQQLGQTPYRANPTEHQAGRVISQFWNSLGPNPLTLNLGLFPHEPNPILGLAWSASHSWSTLNPLNCSSPFGGVAPGGEYNHSRFYIFTVRLRNLPAAPFAGWTDRWGHIAEGCTVAGLDCVPLVVTQGVPAGDALLNRQVNQGNPDQFSNRQQFCEGAACDWLIMPEVPDAAMLEHMLMWQLEAAGEAE